MMFFQDKTMQDVQTSVNLYALSPAWTYNHVYGYSWQVRTGQARPVHGWREYLYSAAIRTRFAGEGGTPEMAQCSVCWDKFPRSTLNRYMECEECEDAAEGASGF